MARPRRRRRAPVPRPGRGRPAGAVGPATRRVLAGALATVLAITLGGCGGDEVRPSEAAWAARWEDAVALVPPRAEVEAGTVEETCEEVLVGLREARSGLSPGPDEAVDQAATEWITFAESTFFECFDPGAGADTVTEAYDRLDQLESEVDALLATDQ